MCGVIIGLEELKIIILVSLGVECVAMEKWKNNWNEIIKNIKESKYIYMERKRGQIRQGKGN